MAVQGLRPFAHSQIAHLHHWLLLLVLLLLVAVVVLLLWPDLLAPVEVTSSSCW
jgi:hypothetical protein